MAATLGESRISKAFATTADIHVLCRNIENPTAPFALRLSASLMLGVVRVYSKKSTIILTDVNTVLDSLKRHTMAQEMYKGRKRKKGDSSLSRPMRENDEVARFESITLPLSKKRKTRTYALPTRADSRSQTSKGTLSLQPPSSSYLGETGEIDVLRAMETLFPSAPVPRLGAHLSSGMDSRSSGYQSGNHRPMLYQAREQDITMAVPTGNLDNTELAMFDEDLPVSNHSDSLSAGGDSLLSADQGNVAEFAAAFGSQRLELEARHEGAQQSPQEIQALPLPSSEGFELQGVPRINGSGSENNNREKLKSSILSGSSDEKTPKRGSSEEVDATQLIATSAARKKTTRRNARLLFDAVTELPPSHIRSCLSNATDIIIEERQDRVTETKSRRSIPDMDFFRSSRILAPFPEEIGNLWRDLTTDTVNGIFADREQSSSSLRLGYVGAPDAYEESHHFPVESKTTTPIQTENHPRALSTQRGRGKADVISVPEMEEAFNPDIRAPQMDPGIENIPNAEVLRATSASGPIQPDFGSLGAPSHSVSGPSSRTFSAKSGLFERDAIFEDITAADKQLYEQACRSVKESNEDGALHERRLSHPLEQGRSSIEGSGNLNPADRSDDGRLDVRASDFELVEETERDDSDRNVGQGPIERIGLLGHKLLEILRSESKQASISPGVSAEQPQVKNLDIITFEGLTANCSRGARARTFFHVLNLISSGYLTPTQRTAYGTISLQQGKFF